MKTDSVSAANKAESVKAIDDIYREYLIDGKTYKIVRHFSDGKDLKTIIEEIASNCAKRDMGL